MSQFNPALPSTVGMTPGHPSPGGIGMALNGSGGVKGDAEEEGEDEDEDEGGKCIVSRLSSLCLGNTSMGRNGLTAISRWLADRKVSLTHLDISRNEICGNRSNHTFDPQGVISLCGVLKTQNFSLTCLNFSKCDIGARSTRNLMGALKVNKRIRTLILDDCNCSEEGVSHIGKALPELEGLTFLSLSNCQAGAIGACALFAGLSGNRSLTYLDVSRSQLTGYWTEQGCAAYDESVVNAICNALSVNNTIEFLDLRDNRLFGLSMEKHKTYDASFVDYMHEGKFRLTVLDKLTGAIAINADINGKLKYLNLSQNRISLTADTCSFCAQAPIERDILDETHSQRFHASHPKSAAQDCRSDCQLNRALQLLAELREVHPSLISFCGLTTYTTHLQCSGMRLCDHFCTLLASELKSSHTLTSLDLSDNQLTARGARSLAAGIRENLSLKCIALPSHRFLSNMGGALKKDKSSARRLAEFLRCDNDLHRIISAAADASVQYRVCLALFVKAFTSTIGTCPVQLVLEFCIWDGPLLQRFMKYQS